MESTRLAIFDFDGTIVDTHVGIVQTTHAVVDRLGLPQPTDEQITLCIGLPLYQSLSRASKVPQERIPEAVDLYHELFDQIAIPLITVFDGVKQTLEELKRRGVRMAIATSRGADSLEKIMKLQGIDHYFEKCLTVDNGMAPKPAPDMVNAILEWSGIPAAEAVVIGDTTFDLQMGQGAGCRVCGVTYGNHDRSRLESVSPTWVVDDMRELLEKI